MSRPLDILLKIFCAVSLSSALKIKRMYADLIMTFSLFFLVGAGAPWQ